MITMIDIITSDLSLHTVLAACCVRPPESGLLLLDPRIFIMMMSERLRMMVVLMTMPAGCDGYARYQQSHNVINIKAPLKAPLLVITHY